MIGSLEDAEDDEEEDDDDPWPFDEEVKPLSFVDDFNVTVSYDVSGGWGVIVILFAIEIALVYFVLLDRT